jgi:hypothetical protein
MTKKLDKQVEDIMAATELTPGAMEASEVLIACMAKYGTDDLDVLADHALVEFAKRGIEGDDGPIQHAELVAMLKETKPADFDDDDGEWINERE